MAKLIVTQNGAVTGNYFIDKPGFTIGSLADNDLCLAVPGISRTHARITPVGNDDILEDLNSTNGTLVNGKQIARHILQHDDVIEIAAFRIRYRSHKAVDGPSFDRTMVIQPLLSEGAAPPQAVGVYVLATGKNARQYKEGDRVGLVKALDGPHAGEEIELLGILRTFGIPGRQVAVINRRPQGYFITHVEGRSPARVNGKSIGTSPRLLAPNDVIEVGGKKLLFLLR
jgi:pSer/pThr/pTyr-binding forkhead associated (FHA) protein